MDYRKIGRLIRKKRRALGYTQEQLSSIVGVTSQAVSWWENGRRFPDAPTQVLLCKALGLNPAELLTGLEMFDDELKQKIAGHMDRMDEKVFVSGTVTDEKGERFYLNLSGYQIVTTDKDGHPSGRWIPFTEYYNVEAPEKCEEE